MSVIVSRSTPGLISPVKVVIILTNNRFFVSNNFSLSQPFDIIQKGHRNLA